MEVFVLKALERLRAESSRSDKGFRDACDEPIRIITENSTKPDRRVVGDGDQYFRAFALALEIKSAKMRAMALDSIEKMIAYKYLPGRMQVRHGGIQRTLIDLVMDAITSCRDDKDDTVQLQVIKAIHTLMTSPDTAHLSEASMLMGMRTVYHICLATRAPVNKNTAKATLRQMLAAIFVKMEAADIEAAAAAAAAGGAGGSAAKAAAAAATAASVSAAATAAAAIVEAAEAGQGEAAASGAAAAPAAPLPAEAVVESALPAVAVAVEAAPVVADVDPSPPLPPNPFAPYMYDSVVSALGLRTLLLAPPAPEAPVVVVAVTSPVATSPAPTAAVVPAPSVAPAPHVPAVTAAAATAVSAPAAAAPPVEPPFPSVSHSDAFILFTNLCRLTAAGDEDPLLPPDMTSAALLQAQVAAGSGGRGVGSVQSDEALIANPRGLQSKLLSLDLVVGLLENAGSCLKNSPRFIAAIRHYLCVGLLKNFVSTIPALSQLSMKAFMALVRSFKKHVTAETEVFISSAFLRILISPSSPHDQKLSVLQSFITLCSDPTSVLEMFLNYDCEQGRQNVFEDSVRALTAMAQGRALSDEPTGLSAVSVFGSSSAAARNKEEALALRTTAMQALSAVCTSIVLLANASAKQMAEAEGGSANMLNNMARQARAAAAAAADRDDDEVDEVGLSSPLASPSGPTTAAPLSSSAALAKSYDEQKRRRALLEKAVVKFASKPKKGVEYMVSVGLCGKEPSSVAAAFHEFKDVLDKTAIGEYMGEEKPIHVATLHAYVDHMDFTGLTFDDAIRSYLSGFRLPGEAQKIDRMMEKFAERFCANNPGVFLNADTPFILSYSIIMLNTDLHNVNIKPEKKMTKESFLRNNRGIDSGSDLPAAFLSAIFDSIQQRPFTLREDDAKRVRLAENAGDERSRRALQQAERESIVAEGAAAMSSARRQTTQRSLALVAAAAALEDGEGATLAPGSAAHLMSEMGLSYYTVSDVSLADHVRPMFEASWGSLLATFSVNFETVGGDAPEDGFTVNACLAGFNQLIHVAAALRLEAERDILVATLCRFTALEAVAPGGPGGGSASSSGGVVRELKGKNIAAVRALLNMAFNEGDLLGASWGPVLVAVSSTARLLNVAMGGKDDSAFFSSVGASVPTPPVFTDRREAERWQKGAERDAFVERANAALIAGAVPEADITRLFTRSTALSSEAIVHFVTQLAVVSLAELSSCVVAPPDLPAIGSASPGSPSSSAYYHTGAAPRVFSLQKVVEVADFNMEVRSRMAWARIWDTLGRFFTATCTSSVSSIAMYAIDLLKQLSLKFLAKPELKAFSFQTRFLQPFTAIMEATSPAAIAARKAAAVRKGAVGTAPRAPGSGGAIAPLGPSPETREVILHVCANIIRARTANIRSGWGSFLSIYAGAAEDRDELLVSLAFSMAHEVLETHWLAVAASGAFVDAVKCMVAFGSNNHVLFALRAIDHCATLGAHLARGRVPLSMDPASAEAEGAADAAAAAAAAGRSSPPSGAAAAASEAPVEGGAPVSTVVAAVLNPIDWYNLDGPENADVIDSQRDLGLQAAAVAVASGASAGAMGRKRGGTAEGEGGGEGGGVGEAEVGGFETMEDATAAEAFVHENATDAAMLAADDQRGGLIRRFSDSTAHLRLWWPLLTGLAGLISSDTRLPVRMRALNALYACLRRYGPGFSPELWALVYSGVMLPIFDDVRHVPQRSPSASGGGGGGGVGLGGSAVAASGGGGLGSPGVALSGRDMEGGEGAEKPHYSLQEFATRAIPSPALVDPTQHGALNASGAGGATSVTSLWPSSGASGGKAGTPGDAHEWLRTTCMPSLSSLVRLQTRFFVRLHFLLGPLLSLIESCIDQEIEGLARIGVACVRLLLAEAGPRFDTQAWSLITASVTRLFALTTPRPLLECRRALLGLTPEEQAVEDANAAAAAAQAAAAAAAAEAAAAAAAYAAARAMGAPVVTSYGAGVLEVPPRDSDGMVKVRLPWAVAYMPLPPQVQRPQAPIVKARPPPPAVVRTTGPPALPFNSVRVVTQCVVQLELIGAVSVLADAHMDSLTLENVETLLGLLQSSAEFAQRFNGDRLLRRALWESGFMRFAKHSKLPSLLRQETCATQCLLVLLLRLYRHDSEVGAGAAAGGATPWRDLSLRGLTTLIQGILERYNGLAVDVQRAQLLALPPYMHASLQFTFAGGAVVSSATAAERDALLQAEHSRDLFREAAAYGPLVLQLLDGLLGFDNAQFEVNLPWLYPLLTGLISAGSVEVRQRVSKVFETRLRALLPLPPVGASAAAPVPATTDAAAVATAAAVTAPPDEVAPVVIVAATPAKGGKKGGRK